MQASQSLKSFSQETSLHGLKNTVEKQNRTKVYQILWILLLLTCCVACISLLTVTIYNYFEYESVTSYTLTYTNTLNYPAVTICNRKILKVTYLEHPLLAQFFSFRADPNSTYFTNRTFQDLFHEELDQLYLEDIYNMYGYKIEETIVSCIINSNQNCKSSFKTLFTESSLCHTFNSEEWINQNGSFVASEAGPTYGLQLVLDISEDPGVFEMNSFLFLIHDPSVYPLLEHGGFVVSPGKETHIALNLNVNERLSTPYSDQECVDTSKPTNNKYSMEKCFIDCYFDKIYGDKCDFFGNGKKKCTMFDMVTITSYLPFGEVYKQCQFCKPTCKTNRYSHSLSMTEIPMHYFETTPFSGDWQEKNNTNRQKNYAVVKIFFERMEYTKTTQKAAVSYQSVMGDIGGLLGFTLGASVITVIEIVEFGLTSLCHWHKKLRPKKYNTDVVPNTK